MLTAGGAGNAAWLASIQKTKGMRSGHHNASGMSAVAVKPKGKSKKSCAVADDEEAQEMETFVKAKGSGGKKGKKSRGGR